MHTHAYMYYRDHIANFPVLYKMQVIVCVCGHECVCVCVCVCVYVCGVFLAGDVLHDMYTVLHLSFKL